LDGLAAGFFGNTYFWGIDENLFVIKELAWGANEWAAAD